MLFRLRSGHSELPVHDPTSSSEACECGRGLSAHHMMIECTKSHEISDKRNALFTRLKEEVKLSDPPTLEELLTPPTSLPREKQRDFLRKVAEFALKLPFDV